MNNKVILFPFFLIKPSSFKSFNSRIIALLSTLKKSAKSVKENGRVNVAERLLVDKIEKYPSNLSRIVLLVKISILVLRLVTLFKIRSEKFSDNTWWNLQLFLHLW